MGIIRTQLHHTNSSLSLSSAVSLAVLSGVLLLTEACTKQWHPFLYTYVHKYHVSSLMNKLILHVQHRPNAAMCDYS